MSWGYMRGQSVRDVSIHLEAHKEYHYAVSLRPLPAPALYSYRVPENRHSLVIAHWCTGGDPRATQRY